MLGGSADKEGFFNIGKTALDWARENGRTSIVALLENPPPTAGLANLSLSSAGSSSSDAEKQANLDKLLAVSVPVHLISTPYSVKATNRLFAVPLPEP